MEIFGYMNEILFKDFDQMMQDVDRKREEMMSADSSLLENGNLDVNLDNIAMLPNGRVNILCDDIVFECMYHYKPGNKLFVILNGAKTQDIPQFNRWSYYKFLDGSVLNIADPMYRIYDDLILGWYYGNKNYDMRSYVAKIVKRIAEILDVDNNHIVFWGSSGGGAATIECASLIPGARAVAINPQIILSEYPYAEEFCRITRNDLQKDIWNRNNAIYFLANGEESYHILVFNIRSASDMKQVENICEELGIILKYGINVFERFIIWLYDAECWPYVSGHCAQEYYCIVFVLEFILNNIGSGNFEKEYSQFFRLINEFWYFRWKQEKDLRNKMPDLNRLIFCRETKKKVAIWGSGNMARKLDDELFEIKNGNYYKIQMVIDNNKDKEKTLFKKEIGIRHPESIDNWKTLFIIIAIEKHDKDVGRQLERMGLLYEEDYIYWKDLYKSGCMNEKAKCTGF